ncbi:flagellar protein FlaG [Endothiovibrio diazotrophicus]
MATEMPTIPPPATGMVVGAAGVVGAEGRLNGQVSLGVGTARPSAGDKVAAQPRGIQEKSDEQAREQQDNGKKDDLAKAVDDMNDRSELLRRNLKFSVDDESGRMVIKVVDSQTDEVIRQIPKEEMLEIARSLEKAEGLLFRAKA